MSNLPKHDIPWDIIADFLTGNISDEQNHQLQQWIAMSDENKASFERIRELWKSGAENYLFYKKASEEDSWKNLLHRMNMVNEEDHDKHVIHARFSGQRKVLRYVLAIASVCIGFMVLIWFAARNRPDIYMAAAEGQKEISLADGSVITLQPGTRIEVAHRFNASNRTVVMSRGEAEFNVAHRPGLPFIVLMGGAEVRDIGTSFIIRRDGGMIHVAVSSGKVAFITEGKKQMKELEAGSSVSYNGQKSEFSGIQPIESSEAARNWLTFENTPLSEVVQSVEKVYARRIEIAGEISNRRLTAKLYGMPFSTAIEVICSSLDLEYTVTDNVYLQKDRIKEE